MSLRSRSFFSVPGLPATKGSTRSFLSRGRVVTKADCARLKPWSRDVQACAAIARIACAPKGVPVKVIVAFHLPAAKGKSSLWHQTRPDLDKLTRALLDALTGLAYADDGQVASLSVTKSATSADARTDVWVEWL